VLYKLTNLKIMIKFKLYFEKRERNPLRKRELKKQNISNYNYVQQQKKKLPSDKQAQIRKMKKLGVEPEEIKTFKQAEIAAREEELKNLYFKKKINKPELLFVKYGIKVLKDGYTSEDLSPGSYRYKMINYLVTKLVREFKDVLPNRKPRIIITDTSKNPDVANSSITGHGDAPPGVYYDKLIYIDQNHIDDYSILTHEYAHYVAGRIPTQSEPMLKAEYKKMLDEYFEKTTRRKSLEGLRNERHRIAMANKLGLPSDYSAANFDEWFAEIITHWKEMPNTKESYRFKAAIKKVLTRI